MAIVHFVNYKRGTQSRAAMRGVMLYVMQEMKTTWEGVPLVSGVNCQPKSVYDDFLNTKLLYHKDGGVMFYHMVQSFPKGAAADPRQAHEAARRLAEYFDGCEVLVCTHVDREHIHSHCVINSVNFDTGKKLHMAKEQLQELMRRNDMICQELGLPVFEPTAQQARGMSGAEYHTALKGQSWKLRLMNTIDACMKYAADKDSFVSLMASEGYQVRWENTRKYITYTTPDGLTQYCKEHSMVMSAAWPKPVRKPSGITGMNCVIPDAESGKFQRFPAENKGTPRTFRCGVFPVSSRVRFDWRHVHQRSGQKRRQPPYNTKASSAAAPSGSTVSSMSKASL